MIIAKRILTILATVLLFSVSVFAQSGNNEPLKGDVNEDGKVDVADVTAVIKIIMDGEEMVTVGGYFYLGTTEPTAVNYKTLPGVVTSYTSIDEAIGVTATVEAGETLYMLCPTAWMQVKKVVVEDENGKTIFLGDEKDEETISGYTIYRTQVWNETLTMTLKTKSVRILDLGNSYTGDATHYLPQILTAANITTGFSLYRVHRTGSCFRNWVNLYKGEDAGGNYKLQKVAGETIKGISGGTGTDRGWFVNLLRQDWDIIIIHQASVYSARYDEWAGDGEAGGLTEYMRILRTYCPKAAIGFYIIHSYASWARNKNNPSEYAYAQGGYLSTERWENIASAVEKLKANYNIDFIIPYGTAVQNLRMTSINPTDPVDNTKKNDFSYDAQHMADGIGDYVAACAYFEALFAPLFNVTVLGNSYIDTNIPVPQLGDDDYYDGRGIPVQITAANALLAQRAAILAVNDMFHLNNPETEDIVPENSDTSTVFEGNGIP